MDGTATHFTTAAQFGASAVAVSAASARDRRISEFLSSFSPEEIVAFLPANTVDLVQLLAGLPSAGEIRHRHRRSA